MRKLLATILVAGTIVIGTATAALAHHNTISGGAVCNVQSGEYEVTWKVVNSEGDKTETITASSRAVVPVGTVLAAGSTSTFSEDVPGDTTSLSLTLSAQWSNGVTNTNTGSAYGFNESGCEKAVTFFTIDTRMPYFHDVVSQEPVGTMVTVKRYCKKFAVKFTEPGGSVFTEIVPSEYRTLLKVRDEAGTIIVSRIGKFAGCK